MNSCFALSELCGSTFPQTDQYRPDVKDLFISTFIRKKRVSENTISFCLWLVILPIVSLQEGLSYSTSQGTRSQEDRYFLVV